MSASTIKAGRAAVEAFLDDKKLSADLKGMQSRLRVAGNLAAKVVGASMLAVAGGAVYKIREQMTKLDEIGKRSRTLGMDPAELMALGYAAEQSAGMTGEAFAKGYAKVNTALQEARKQAGPARDMFDAMGLDAEKLAAMSAPERMMALADGFASVPDPGRRAAMAVKLFGEEGSRLANLLSQGGGEIDRLTSKWQKITGIKGGMDTSAIERANDALSDIKLTLDAVFQKATMDNAKDLAVAFEMIAAAAMKASAANADGDQGKQRMIPWMADMAQVVVDPTAAWFEGVVTASGGAGTAAGELFAGNFGAAASGAGQVASGWEQAMFGPLRALSAMLTGVERSRGEKISDAADMMDAAAAAANATAEADRKLAEEQAVAAATAAELADKQEAFAEQARSVVQKLREQVEYFGKTSEEIAVLKLRAGEAGDESATLADELEKLAAAHQELEAAKDVADSVQKMATAFREEAESVGRTTEELERLRMARLESDPAAEAEDVEQLRAAYDALTDARAQAAQAETEKQLREDVDALTQSWIDLAETVGKSQEELEDMEIQRLRDRGAGDVEIQTAVEALAAVRAARLKADAEALRDSLKTNQERYAAEMDVYDRMLEDKLISDKEHERARAALTERLGLDKDMERRISVAGTFSGARLGAAMGGGQLEEKQLRAAEAAEKHLKRIEDRLSRLGGMTLTN